MSTSAPPPAADPPDADGRVDAVAARRALRRLSLAGEPPWLHREAARRMAERLPWIKAQPERVLDWSGAAGASEDLLAAAYPAARQLWVGDGESGGLAAPPAWWRRLVGGRAARQRLTAADARQAAAGLVWSNMRLHFEPDPQPMLRAWRDALAPGGFLMFSTLGPGSLSVLRELYERRGWGPAHAPFIDMHDLGDMLVAHGFAEPVMDQETLNLDYAGPEALLAELRGLGANLAPRRFAGLRTPRWRRLLHAGLREAAAGGERLRLQVELVYGHAFRAPDAGPRVESQTTIALGDMKLMLRKPRQPK
jgi:malonyl-CoA O-methyltransferase